MGKGLGLAAISDARASACVSIYSRTFVNLPFRTVMSKTQWSSNVLFVALILPVAKPTTRTRSPCAMNSGGTSIVLRDSPRTRPRWSFREIGAKANSNVAHYGGGGAPTTIVCGSLSFDRASLKPITQLLPSFILLKADKARTLALHNTMQALASEMAEQSPGSEVVATRLAEVLFIQALRAHIASGPERNKGWLRAIFDPQMGTALSAIHDRVNTHPGRSNLWPKRRPCLAPHSQRVLKSYSDKHRWNM
jgi:hypothetical protein